MVEQWSSKPPVEGSTPSFPALVKLISFYEKVAEWFKVLVCYTSVHIGPWVRIPSFSKFKRVSVNGKRFAFQAETVGSIPTTRKLNISCINDLYFHAENQF